MPGDLPTLVSAGQRFVGQSDIPRAADYAAGVSEQWLLPAVERTSTIEQVHRVLREGIISGSIPQGTRLLVHFDYRADNLFVDHVNTQSPIAFSWTT